MSDPQSDQGEGLQPGATQDNLSDAAVATFIHDYLDTFAKRDLVEFFATQPDAVATLSELEAQLKADRFILLRQVRELKELGLLDYHYAAEHTRVWHLAPTEWARQMVRAVVAHWAKYPSKRKQIVRRGRRTPPPTR